MTPKERAAMQQALEALEQYHYTLISAGVLDKQHVLNQGFTAHAALREALAEQAEQEPVAWMCWIDSDEEKNPIKARLTSYEPKAYGKRKPLYAAPPRTKDLTDDEIWKVIDTVNPSSHIEDLNPLSLCRAVIAADREKINDAK